MVEVIFSRMVTRAASADGLVPMHVANFTLHLRKMLRLPRKSDARYYNKVLHLSRKITLANLKVPCSKTQPLSGNERPDLLTFLTNTSLVLHPPFKMHLSRSCHRVWKCSHDLLTFDKVQNP